MSNMLSKKNVKSFATYLIPFSLTVTLLALWEAEVNLLVLILSSFVFFVYFYILHTKFKSEFKHPLLNLLLLFVGIITPMLVLTKVNDFTGDYFSYLTLLFIAISYICLQKPQANSNFALHFTALFIITAIIAVITSILIGWGPIDLGKFTQLGLISLAYGCFLIGVIIGTPILNKIWKILKLDKL